MQTCDVVPVILAIRPIVEQMVYCLTLINIVAILYDKDEIALQIVKVLARLVPKFPQYKE